MIVALLALFVALGGSSYAAIKVGSRQIADNSVRSKDIRNNDIRSADVRNGTLLAKDFRRGQLPSGQPGPQGPAGPKGDQGSTGVLGVYRSTLPISLAASGIVRVAPQCNSGDRATGGGYFLNTSALSDAQIEVEVYSNGPDTTGNNQSPPGWDIGIRNKTTTARSGFAFAVCADLAP